MKLLLADPALLHLEPVVDSCAVKEKDLQSSLDKLDHRISKLENSEPWEIPLGSPIDQRLQTISDGISELGSNLSGVSAKLDSHIKFAWTCIAALFGLCLIGAGTLYEMHSSITHLNDFLPTGQLQTAIQGTMDEEKISRVQDILTDARSAGKVIESKVIRKAGDKLIGTVNENQPLAPSAWKAFLDLVSYQSFINHQVNPQVIDHNSAKKPPPSGEFISLTPDSHNTISNSVFEGGQQTLDGGIWLNDTFIGTKIIYKGSPTSLVNVHFENCTFQFTNTPNSEKLGIALLRSHEVQLDISG